MGEAAALGSAAFWAVSAIIIKSVSGRLSAFYIMSVRTGVGAVLALAIFAAFGNADSVLDIPQRTVIILLTTAVLAIMGDVAFVRAMAVEDVSRVFIVSTSLYILISVTGSVLFAGESWSWLLILGGAAILAGSRLVMRRSDGDTPRRLTRDHRPMLALGMAIIASILWSASLLLVSEAMESVNALSATAIRLPFMAIVLATIATVRGEHRRGFDRRDIGKLAVSGCLVVGAMMLFLLAAKNSSAGTVAVLTSTSPIFVAPLAHLFLDERLTLRTAGGTLSCMLGIWLASS